MKHGRVSDEAWQHYVSDTRHCMHSEDLDLHLPVIPSCQPLHAHCRGHGTRLLRTCLRLPIPSPRLDLAWKSSSDLQNARQRVHLKS